MEENMVREAWQHAWSPSEIPCRASSDVHEWHNGLNTVLKRASVKLQRQ